MHKIAATLKVRPAFRTRIFAVSCFLSAFSSPVSKNMATEQVLSNIGDASAIRTKWLARDGEHDHLKDVLGEKSLDWVKERNVHSVNALGDPNKSPLYDKILSILDSSDKIPYLRKINDHYYNFWQDKANPRGLWRRTTMESYTSASPEWEIVLDFDALGKAEGESWVYKGHTVYEPPFGTGNIERTMMQLSRGGADAVVLREFDLTTKSFVTENAFEVPESKSRVSWRSKDILFVGTDMKDGTSMTDSGYPRVMREWHRGTPLSESKVVYEGETTDVAVFLHTSQHRQHSYLLKGRSITFYTSTNSIFLPASKDAAVADVTDAASWHELKVPLDSEISIFADQLLVQLRSDWVLPQQTYKQGSLLAVSVQEFVDKATDATFTELFQPSPTVSLESFSATKDYLVLQTLDTVKSRFVFWEYQDANQEWTFRGAEENANIRGSSLSAVDGDASNDYWFITSSFLQPTTLQLGDASVGPEGVQQVRTLKSLPAQFNATGLVEQQFQATSEDGTKVPYFLISHADMPLDGSTPTLLYGYGGFEISLPPAYSGVVGAGWLDTTGEETDGQKQQYRCYVVANIRGGGEFGPAWHQAALRENRKLAYDDFIAVADDLIARKVTSPSRLGIRGGSNGGLLMGNMFVRRPDLFGAVCCAVPLLDMKAYHQLLAGASWMAEYGNPDVPEDWAFLQAYSAYHNIDPALAATGRYPALLMTTSTRDDRVHPYHARCFVKRLLDCLEEPLEGVTQTVDASTQEKVLYYENIEGGHGGAADNKQQAYMSVMYLEFLKKVLR